MSALTSKTLVFGGTIGSRHLYIWEITGDGAATTLDSGLATCDQVWVQSQDDTDVAPSAMLVSGIANGIVTLGTAPTNAFKWWVFCLGS